MPQPLRYRDGDITTGVAALESRPQLAVAIAAVMNEWTELENVLAQAFVALLGGSESSAFDIYDALIDRGIRETVHLVLARGRLPTALVARTEKIFVRVRKLASARNDIAHGYWATLSTRPESLLLCPKNYMARESHQNISAFRLDPRWKHASEAEITQAVRKLGMPEAEPPPVGTEFTEYTKKDFEETVKRISDVANDLWFLGVEGLIYSRWRERQERNDQSGAPPSQSTPGRCR